ncbi:MAG: serine/threonine protein kinase, partial [Acidimicrobiia bacterium]|nr:serine/threonine protein kinase [Acidimicrobiia bacterium]
MDGIGREGEASDPIGRGTSRLISGYDELVRVGSGGSSTVYRALDVRHQRRVAIKVLDLDASSGPRRTAFQREIEAIGRVGSHPYIVTVLGSGFTVDHHPFLVLPLFDRGTFSRLIDEQGPLTWPAAVDIGIKLCSAVETVHRAGVLHRDIKPGNVFVGVTPEHPLLADFG